MFAELGKSNLQKTYTGITIAYAYNPVYKDMLYAGLAVDLKMFTAYNLLKSLLVEE